MGDEEREESSVTPGKIKGWWGDGCGGKGRFLSGLAESEMLLRPLSGASEKA